MTIADERKKRLANYIRQVWDDGDVDAADAYIAEICTIQHDPGDPWEGQALNRAALKDRDRRSRAAFPGQSFDIQAMSPARITSC